MHCFHYRYLVEGSCGIPFYCEELLKNLDHHRVLVFQTVESEEKTNVTWNNLFSKSHNDGTFSLSPSAERVARVGFSIGCFLYGSEALGRQRTLDLISQIVRELNIARDSLNWEKECRRVIEMKEHWRILKPRIRTDGGCRCYLGKRITCFPEVKLLAQSELSTRFSCYRDIQKDEL